MASSTSWNRPALTCSCAQAKTWLDPLPLTLASLRKAVPLALGTWGNALPEPPMGMRLPRTFRVMPRAFASFMDLSRIWRIRSARSTTFLGWLLGSSLSLTTIAARRRCSRETPWKSFRRSALSLFACLVTAWVMTSKS